MSPGRYLRAEAQQRTVVDVPNREAVAALLPSGSSTCRVTGLENGAKGFHIAREGSSTCLGLGVREAQNRPGGMVGPSDFEHSGGPHEYGPAPPQHGLNASRIPAAFLQSNNG